MSSRGRRNRSVVPSPPRGQALALLSSQGEFGLSVNKLLFIVRFYKIFISASVIFMITVI